MPVLILSPTLAEKVMSERGKSPDHRTDEVWDGVDVITPEADIEHDDIAGFFYRAFWAAFGEDTSHRINFRVNVSDRVENWTSNYRIPDTAVYLADNPARQVGPCYSGGPDLALEVVSPGDRSRDKLDFYAAVGTREVLIVDREPWQIELYQLGSGRMQLVGQIIPGDGKVLSSFVVPVSIELIPDIERPKIRLVLKGAGQQRVH